MTSTSPSIEIPVSTKRLNEFKPLDSLAETYEERAAILEFDGRLSRSNAEALAFEIVYGGER